MKKLKFVLALSAIAIGVLAFGSRTAALNETYRWGVTDSIVQTHENGSTMGVFNFARGEGDARVYSRFIDNLSNDGTYRCWYEISTRSPYRTGEISLGSNSSPRCSFNFGPNPITISGNFPGEVTSEISFSNLSHIHLQSFDEEGKNSTGEMNDGKSKDLVYFLIRPNGEIVWQLCQTRDGGTEIGTHWFHPSYGKPISFRTDGSKTNINNVTNNSKTCDEAEFGPPEGTFGARPDWIYDGKIKVGETWTIRAIGVGGDLPVFPDSNSQYNDTMSIKLLSVGEAEYRSPGVQQSGDKFVEGDPVVRKITVPQGACPPTATLTSRDNTCPEPSGGAFVFNVFSTEGGGLISIINAVLSFFIEQMKQMITQLNRIVQNIITIPHSYFTGEGANKGVVNAWQVARGIANTLFVLVLIVLAMANILRYQIEKYDVRATIPRLIVAVILTNFSLLIIGLLVDITNVATIAIKAGFDAIASTDTGEAVNIAAGSAQGAFAILLVALMFILLLIVVLWIVILLAFRVAVIFAMAALAPIAFMFFSLPATAGMLQTWWKNLVRFLIMGPVIMFLLSMSGTIITSIQKEEGTDDLALLLSFFVAIGFVAIAGMVPVMLGGKAFSSFGSYAKRFGAFAGKRAAGSALGRGVARGLQAANLGSVPGLNRIPGVRRLGVPGAKGAGTRLGALSAGIGAAKQKRVEAAASIMSTAALKSRWKNAKKGDEKFAMGKVLDSRSALGVEDYAEMVKTSGPRTNEAIGIAIKAAQEKDPRIAGELGKIAKSTDPRTASIRASVKALPEHYQDTGLRIGRTSPTKFADYRPEVMHIAETRTNLRVTNERQLGNWSTTHLKMALDPTDKDGNALAPFEAQTQKLIEGAAKKAGLTKQPDGTWKI